MHLERRVGCQVKVEMGILWMYPPEYVVMEFLCMIPVCKYLEDTFKNMINHYDFLYKIATKTK